MPAEEFIALGGHLILRPAGRALVQHLVESLGPPGLPHPDSVFLLPGIIVVLEGLHDAAVHLIHGHFLQLFGREQQSEIGFGRFDAPYPEVPERGIDVVAVADHRGYGHLQQLAEFAERSGKHRRRPAERIARLGIDDGDVFVADEILAYMVRIAHATRVSEALSLGISPRGTLALSKMARANAWIKGRKYVIPQDVTEVCRMTLTHRLVLTSRSRVHGVTGETALADILASVPEPKITMK